MTMKEKTAILCLLAFAVVSFADTLPGFEGADLGKITCAWKFSHAQEDGGEKEDATWCVLALAQKAVLGEVAPPAMGFDLRQVDVQVQDAVVYRRAQSFVFAEDVLVGTGYGWNIRVTATDGKGDPRKERQLMTLAPLAGYADAIPEGALFQLKDSAGKVVQDAIEPTKENALSLLPGVYSLHMAIQLKEVSFKLTVAPGWNLVGIPLAKVDAAAEFLRDCLVFDPSNGNLRVTDVSMLAAGAAYWVYSGAMDAREYTVSGYASTSQKSHLPELRSRWNFVCPVAQLDDGGALQLCNVPPARCWDNGKGCFSQLSEGRTKAILGKGYILWNVE